MKKKFNFKNSTEKKNVLLIVAALFYISLTYEWVAYPFVYAGIVFILSFSRMVGTIKSEGLISLVNFITYGSLCAYLFALGFTQLFSLLYNSCPQYKHFTGTSLAISTSYKYLPRIYIISFLHIKVKRRRTRRRL